MTRRTTSRVAGSTFLLYIAAGLANEFFIGRATNAEGTAATLARVAVHATDVRLTVLLKLLECFSALVLAVMLYGLTRDEDQELALLAMACRVTEGVILAVSIRTNLGLLWLVDARAAMDAQTANALGTSLLIPNGPLPGVFFAVGNTIFAALLLRGRLIPAPLAWLGVTSSALLAIGVPLQLAGLAPGPVIGALWVLAFLYAVLVGLWLLIKGVATP